MQPSRIQVKDVRLAVASRITTEDVKDRIQKRMKKELQDVSEDSSSEGESVVSGNGAMNSASPEAAAIVSRSGCGSSSVLGMPPLLQKNARSAVAAPPERMLTKRRRSAQRWGTQQGTSISAS